ncbi:VOC family protein [Nocardioides eburneiflavus]|uniref:VOC family protein n=1 Tax=Nocardioides eburneiflavus TaxID=2518372 RepID=A0A4Z1CBF7_9ACTN|nr:VOC family protein [Nocardioides eburneiflavus]TGN64926.1 VOC family protein [Nocardioides eburneiflavus]
MPDDQYASVRYLVDDVDAAVAFYTDVLGFTVLSRPAPPFADVVRGHLRLMLSGPLTSGARATPDGLAGPGRNRIHLVVADLDAELVRLREAGVEPLGDVVEGPGGRQVLVVDPAGNPVEVFEPAS